MIRSTKTISGLSGSGKTTKCIEELLLMREDSRVVVFSADRDFSYVAEDEGYDLFLSGMTIWEPQRWSQEELETAIVDAMYKGNKVDVVILDDILDEMEITDKVLSLVDSSITSNIIIARSMNRDWEGLERKRRWFRRD